MMSQMGSPAAPARAEASPDGSTSLGRQFMSAMLTYFGFMLQKRRYRRKDRTRRSFRRARTASLTARPTFRPVIPGLAGGRKVLELAQEMRHHHGGDARRGPAPEKDRSERTRRY